MADVILKPGTIVSFKYLVTGVRGGTEAFGVVLPNDPDSNTAIQKILICWAIPRGEYQFRIGNVPAEYSVVTWRKTRPHIRTVVNTLKALWQFEGRI